MDLLLLLVIIFILFGGGYGWHAGHLTEIHIGGLVLVVVILLLLKAYGRL